MSRNLEDTAIALENKIQDFVRAMDSLIDKYLGIVARRQFDVNSIESIEDIFDATSGICKLTGNINQLIVVETIAWTVPSGTTSLVIKLGRQTYTIANPATVYSWPHLKKIVGQGDAITATITPPGAGTFAVFGFRSGNTQQL